MERGTLFVLLCLSMPVPSVAADRYANLDYAFRSGDFGTGSTVDLTALTVSLGWLDSDQEFSVAIPYLSVDEESADSVSGLGDVLLRGSRDFTIDRKNQSQLTGAVNVKLPTADDADGLGSGELDVGIGIAWSAMYGDWKPIASAGYTLVGDPSGVDYDDVFSYGVGIFRRLTRSGVYAALDGRSAMIDGTDDPLEASIGGFYLFSSSYALNAGAFQGLSDGSADYGFNVGLLRRF
jgi:hypothetical protein